MNKRPFMLAAALLLAVSTSALAQPSAPRSPVSTERTDGFGVAWIYEESADPMDDKWQVLAYGELTRGPDRGAIIGLFCAEGWGVKTRLDVPHWVIGDGNRRTLRARIDAAPAFPIAVVGEPSAPSFVWIPQTQGGADLASALIRSARDRIAIQGPDGLVTTFPMGADRPEMTRAWARCRELLRMAPEPGEPAQ